MSPTSSSYCAPIALDFFRNKDISRNLLGAYGAQDRSVHVVHEDPSTEATQKLPKERMFRKKSIGLATGGIIMLADAYKSLQYQKKARMMAAMYLFKSFCDRVFGVAF
jgi:hypothetical protein